MKRKRGNPTLVHHGAAKHADWHLISTAGVPLADLYSVGPQVAMHVARSIAQATGYAVHVHDNRRVPQRPVPQHRKLGVAGTVAEANPGRRSDLESINAATAKVLRAGGFNALARDVISGKYPAPRVLRFALEVEASTSKRPAVVAGLQKALASIQALGRAKLGNPIPRSIDKRSIRTVQRGKARVLVGCPKGKFHPRSRSRRKCSAPMRAVEVKRNPVDDDPRQFSVGDVVKISALPYFGRWGTVEKIGHRLLSVRLTLTGRLVKFRAGDLQLANRRVANPCSPPRAVLESGIATFRRWHEFDPSRLSVRRTSSRMIPHVLVELGEVPEIVYRSDKWTGKPVTYVHKTGRPRPKLCTGPTGRGLFLVGGNVRVTGRGLVG